MCTPGSDRKSVRISYVGLSRNTTGQALDSYTAGHPVLSRCRWWIWINWCACPWSTMTVCGIKYGEMSGGLTGQVKHNTARSSGGWQDRWSTILRGVQEVDRTGGAQYSEEFRRLTGQVGHNTARSSRGWQDRWSTIQRGVQEVDRTGGAQYCEEFSRLTGQAKHNAVRSPGIWQDRWCTLRRCTGDWQEMKWNSIRCGVQGLTGEVVKYNTVQRDSGTCGATMIGMRVEQNAVDTPGCYCTSWQNDLRIPVYNIAAFPPWNKQFFKPCTSSVCRPGIYGIFVLCTICPMKFQTLKSRILYPGAEMNYSIACMVVPWFDRKLCNFSSRNLAWH